MNEPANTTTNAAPALVALDDSLIRFLRIHQRQDVRRFIESRLPVNVDQRHYRVLRGIEAVADQAPAIGELAELLDLDMSTVSRMVDRAIEVGLVERSVCADDARRRTLTLTRAGRRALKGGTKARMELWEALSEGISADSLASAAEVFEQLSARADELGDR